MQEEEEDDVVYRGLCVCKKGEKLASIAHKCALFLFAALVKYTENNKDIWLAKQLKLGLALVRATYDSLFRLAVMPLLMAISCLV